MKPRIDIGAWTGLVCGLVLSGAFAAQDPAATVNSQDVVVQAKPLRELRADARKAQRRFETLYGQLNQDADQQMSCQDSAATGSRFTKRTCTTRAAETAKSLATQDYVGSADLNASVKGQPGARTETSGPVETAVGATAPAAMSERYASDRKAVDMTEYQSAYWKNLLKLMSQHPELQKSFDEYAQAKARLDAAQNGSNAGKQ
ncbi:MAG TPA: hypothetical protein VN645_07480 [Steroidobacteraceae bacterium]|nr:hypothetical protein [Steroidobacteraceae bacterium]